MSGSFAGAMEDLESVPACVEMHRISPFGMFGSFFTKSVSGWLEWEAHDTLIMSSFAGQLLTHILNIMIRTQFWH